MVIPFQVTFECIDIFISIIVLFYFSKNQEKMAPDKETFNQLLKQTNVER